MRNLYYCPACRQCRMRDSSKKWLTSYCDAAGRSVRMQLVEEKKKKKPK